MLACLAPFICISSVKVSSAHFDMAGASAVDNFIIRHTSLCEHDHTGVISMPHNRSLWLSVTKFSCLVISAS